MTHVLHAIDHWRLDGEIAIFGENSFAFEYKATEILRQSGTKLMNLFMLWPKHQCGLRIIDYFTKKGRLCINTAVIKAREIPAVQQRR